MIDKPDLPEGTDGTDLQQPGVGSIFRQTRESKGIKIQEISRVTRIRQSFIEAIENEEWNLLPPTGFIPGFLKTYAKYLGMNETEILAKYHAGRQADKERLASLHKKEKDYKKNLLIWVFGALFAAVIGIFIVLNPSLWKEKYTNFFNFIKSEIVEPKGSGNYTSSAFISNNEYGNGEEKLTSDEYNPEDSFKQDATSSEQKNAERKIDNISAALNISGSSGQLKTNEAVILKNQIPEKGYLLEVIVLADVFLRIKIDDSPPTDYMLKAGTTTFRTAEEKFELRIGNAASLVLMLNGEEVKNIGAPGQVVNLRLPRN